MKRDSETLRRLIEEHCGGRVDDDLDLIASAILTSQRIVGLVLDLEEKLGLQFETADLNLRSFRTVSEIESLVRRYADRE